MSTALSLFLSRQLDAMGLTAEQFARKAGLNASGIYQIVRGERIYVQDRTLDKIAAALNMTPAEMALAMGKAAATEDPDEAEILALFRDVPTEKRSAAKDVLRGLGIQPTSRGRVSSRIRRPVSKPRTLDQHDDRQPPHGPDDGLTPRYHGLGRVAIRPR